MFKLILNGSQIVVGESHHNLAEYLPADKQTIVIIDANIVKNYRQFFSKWSIIEIHTGEKYKTIDMVVYIYKRLMDYNIDRNSFIVAVGGGLLCDIAGFAASTFLRGIPFGFVPTTLLAQVDASVGGKNGVNFGGYKNIIGTFNQPRFVLCDIEMLKTLPQGEYISGFAEIVKMAAIRNVELFEYLEQNLSKAFTHDQSVLEKLVIGSVKIKAEIVEHDERENGERRVLNFGHTFGHAIEAITGISHGEAVSIGMMIAARWSIAECGFPQTQYDRLERLLARLGLPINTDLHPEAINHALMKDKKRESDHIHFVLLSEIGKAVICKTPIENILHGKIR